MQNFEFIMIEKIENKFFSCITLEDKILHYHDLYLMCENQARHENGSGGTLDSDLFSVPNSCIVESKIWVNPKFKVFLEEKTTSDCIDPIIMQGKCPISFKDWEEMIVEDLEYPQIEVHFYQNDIEIFSGKIYNNILQLFKKSHEAIGGENQCTTFYYLRDEKGYPIFDDFENIEKIALEKYSVVVNINFISD